MITRRALALTALTPLIAQAQDYPARLMTMVVPFTPGGSTDILARLLMQKISENTGQPHIVENRGGAGGSIATAAVSTAKPDGYTILFGHIGTLAVNPSIYPKLEYDSVNGFAHVSPLARIHNVIGVHPKHGFKTLADLVNYAKTNPNKLTYGSGGNGSAAHIATAALMIEAGISMLHVPYRGTSPAVNDLIGGQIDLMFTGATTVLNLAKAGHVTMLASSSLARLPSAPELPTVAETYKGFEASQWHGILLPANTPPEIVTRLNREVIKAMNSPSIIARLNEDGGEVWTSSPAEFKTHIAHEITRWKVVVDKAGIRL
jgi:tripartite-type tricarboxylate transporter receptor subunit TctC